MGCLSSQEKEPQTERKFSMTEEDQIEMKIRKINMYIDNYNRQVDKLEETVKDCHKKALENKSQKKKQLSLYYINKKKILEKEAQKFQQRSILLFDRKMKIQDLEDQREFGLIMKETNDLLENHINQNIINELQRMNQIDQEIKINDELIANQVYSAEVNEEYDRLNVYNNEFTKIKESISLSTIGKKNKQENSNQMQSSNRLMVVN